MRLALLLVLATAVWSRGADADPASTRVITAPTAWLPETGTIVGTAGEDNLGALPDGPIDGNVFIGGGLGSLAAVEVGLDTDVHGCLDCTQPAKGLVLGRAAFKLGVHQDTWFDGQPALLVGTRITFAASSKNDFERVRVTDIHVVASRVVGPLRLHAGASLIDAGFGGTYHMGMKLRPLAALEWTAPQVPKSTLMADIAYVPRFETDHAVPEWVAGLGVRYQALTWGSIEIGVRTRDSEDVSNATIFVRVNGVLDLR
jgi:hypothetical protein